MGDTQNPYLVGHGPDGERCCLAEFLFKEKALAAALVGPDAFELKQFRIK